MDDQIREVFRVHQRALRKGVRRTTNLFDSRACHSSIPSLTKSNARAFACDTAHSLCRRMSQFAELRIKLYRRMKRPTTRKLYLLDKTARRRTLHPFQSGRHKSTRPLQHSRRPVSKQKITGLLELVTILNMRVERVLRILSTYKIIFR